MASYLPTVVTGKSVMKSKLTSLHLLMATVQQEGGLVRPLLERAGVHGAAVERAIFSALLGPDGDPLLRDGWLSLSLHALAAKQTWCLSRVGGAQQPTHADRGRAAVAHADRRLADGRRANVSA